jgi:hypothetical protein
MAVPPWPGYDDMTESRRKELLDLKVDEARLRWDLLYAQAVASAVASYEALQRGAGAQPNEVEQAAEEQLEIINKAAGWGFSDEAGSWGHR